MLVKLKLVRNKQPNQPTNVFWNSGGVRGGTKERTRLTPLGPGQDNMLLDGDYDDDNGGSSRTSKALGGSFSSISLAIFALFFSLPPTSGINATIVVMKIRGHLYSRLVAPPRQPSLGSWNFYRGKPSALSSLVDSSRNRIWVVPRAKR